MKREVKSSEIKEIVLNPAYLTNDDFKTIEIQGFPVRWMREDEGSDKEIFTLLVDDWIPCSERLPENELDVEITYIREHYLTGEKLYLTARAFYEDGTYTTEDSAYSWDEADDWEYDEKTESYKIPEGWFESVSFAERFEAVDMPVIAWRPIAKPYKP